MRKEKISQIDEIDKEINKSYVNSLLKVKGDDINPILFGEMPLEKYKEMRKNKRERNESHESPFRSSPQNMSTVNHRNFNSEVGISNNYSTKNNIIRANNSDNLNSSFQYKPTHSNKYISGRNLIMNTGTNVIEASNFNPIKVVDDMGSKSSIIQNKTPNQVRINKHEDKNSFSRLGFDKEIEKNADFNPHLEYNLRRAPRHSIVNISNGIDSSQRNRNGNQTVILSESYRSPGKVTLLHPEIDQKIVRNNKMDHITTYIFNEK